MADPRLSVQNLMSVIWEPVRTAFSRSPAISAKLAATQSSPHVRDAISLEGAMRYVMVALIPCLAMAFFNTGYQANVEVALSGVETAPGWRGTVLSALGVGYDLANIWATFAHGALYFLPVLTVTIVVGGFWERLFAQMRNRPVAEGFIVIALVFALSLPPSIPLWQAALGISFAIVIGKEIFGGTGKNFLNPALTGLVFLYVTYPKGMISETAWTVVDAFTAPTYLQMTAQKGPETVAWLGTTWMATFVGISPGSFGTTSTLACLLGAAFLLSKRIASARIIAGILLGMIAAALLLNQIDNPPNAFFGLAWHWHLTLGSFAFGTVFLATDPVSAAMTNTGRWVYGVVIGVMIVFIRVANPTHPDGVMFAILFGNIFAPLIDYLVMRADIRRRARRNG